jgi:hypothetical protein
MNKILRNILGILLIFLIIIFVLSYAYRYKVDSKEVYKILLENLVEDGSFENFNESVMDCCMTPETINEARISAINSKNSVDGIYSLNLTSSRHCACIYKTMKKLTNSEKYYLSFYYKGDNPKFCNWVGKDNQCLPIKNFEETFNWTKYNTILSFTNKSESAFIYFYADSDGSETVTNIYDDLQVHKLVQIYKKSGFDSNSDYIIKTKKDNIVNGELISDEGNDEAYFYIMGEPKITLKFPWEDLILIIVFILIIIRLIFKKDESELQELSIHRGKEK